MRTLFRILLLTARCLTACAAVLVPPQSRQEPGEKDLKIEDINNKLNELATAATAEEKTAILSWLVQRSNARMLKWITQIICRISR